MLICVICGEEVLSEADMKTHLLLSHLENEMRCPLCSLSGVSYDELNFHICRAHTEAEGQDGIAATHLKAVNRQRLCKDKIGDNTIKMEMKELIAEDSTVDISRPLVTEASSHTASSQGHKTHIPQDGITCSPHGASSDGTTSHIAAPDPGGTGQEFGRLGHHTKAREGDAEENLVRKSKQKRLSSPLKERQFACPLCALVCNDCFILQEHVELHLQEQAVVKGAAAAEGGAAEASVAVSGDTNKAHSSSGMENYECPLCSLLCDDSTILQEHVEWHLDCEAAADAASPSSDLRLARWLQKEEEQSRREQEAKQEAEDFKKLQRQFGLDNSGGYRKQKEKSMERAVSRGLMAPAEFHKRRAEMMEGLASGVDDGQTKTSDLVHALYGYYQREARDIAHVWLCAETDHYSSSDGDSGWGCGYRNFQMLLSCLHQMEPYSSCLSDKSVPSIPRVQGMIEEAWAEGADPQGASHFNRRLQGSRAWIGATEIYALLTSLKLAARIVDFHQPTGPGDTHPRLFEWVKQYFSLATSGGTKLQPKVVRTTRPPVYLQHQGHSRSIVGVEQRKNGSLCLLLFDPGCSSSSARKLLTAASAAGSIRSMRKFPGNLKHRQYQIVVVEGVLSPEEKQNRILQSRTLHAERIP